MTAIRYSVRSNITKKKIRSFFRHRFNLHTQPFSPITQLYKIDSLLKVNKVYKFILLNRQFMKQVHGITRDVDLRHFHKYAFKKAHDRQYAYLFMMALERRLTSVLYQARLISKVKQLRVLIKKGRVMINDEVQRSLMHRVNHLDFVHYNNTPEEDKSFFFLDRPFYRMLIWKMKLVYRYLKKFMYIYLKKIYLRYDFSRALLHRRYLYHIFTFSSFVSHRGGRKHLPFYSNLSKQLQVGGVDHFVFPALSLISQKFIVSFFFLITQNFLALIFSLFILCFAFFRVLWRLLSLFFI